MIEVRLYGPFRDATDEPSVDIDPGEEATVESVLRTFGDGHPDVAERLFDEDGFRDSINVTKNGTNVRLLDGERTPVSDGDRISITAALEGG